MDCRPHGSSIHGILQARVLELGAIALEMDKQTLQRKGMGEGDWTFIKVAERLAIQSESMMSFET